jgi:hypothetical protein
MASSIGVAAWAIAEYERANLASGEKAARRIIDKAALYRWLLVDGKWKLWNGNKRCGLELA